MNPLFHQFNRILTTAESLTFAIEKIDDAKLRIIVNPKLKDAPTGSLSDDDASLRAALALPLIVNASADELDTEFPACLAAYTHQREQLADALSTLDTLKDATKQAQNAAEARKQNTKSNKDVATDKTPDANANNGNEGDGKADKPTPPKAQSSVLSGETHDDLF